jgi:hypothetical protein
MYSIKSSKGDFLKKKIGRLDVPCGRYTPLRNAHDKIKLDWIMVYYDKEKNTVKKVYYVPHEKVNSEICFLQVIRPLTAKRHPGRSEATSKFSKSIFKQII